MLRDKIEPEHDFLSCGYCDTRIRCDADSGDDVGMRYGEMMAHVYRDHAAILPREFTDQLVIDLTDG